MLYVNFNMMKTFWSENDPIIIFSKYQLVGLSIGHGYRFTQNYSGYINKIKNLPLKWLLFAALNNPTAKPSEVFFFVLFVDID